MPSRERIMLQVMVDLDPVPGAMHTPDGARAIVEAILMSRIPHYTPVVVVPPDEPVDATEG